MIRFFDNLFDKVAVVLCGFLGHEYIREANGFTYCRHCGHVVKGKD